MHNYIAGQWTRSAATETVPVLNPATGEELDRTPLSPAAEVEQAARAAARAFPAWRRVPVGERIQYLFKLKTLLEEHIEDLARTITMEAGKTLVESRGEMRRAIENVEVACGAPIDDPGLQLRGHRRRHRRDDDPPAARRLAPSSRRSTSPA